MKNNESKEWSIETALEGISHFVPEYFPEQELAYLLTKPDEVTPLLLKALDDAANVNNPIDDSMLPEFALYLLAHFRNEAAFPKIINILKLPDERPYRILGDDCITDYGMRNILASTFNGDLSLLTTIIENRDIEQFIRGSVLNTFIPLVLLEKIERKTVTAYITTLIEEKLEKEQPYLWAVVTGVVMDLYLDELVPSILDAFQKNYVDENYCSIEDFQSWFEDKTEYTDAIPHLKEKYHFIDAIQDTKWWACFQSEKTIKKTQAMLDNFLKRLTNQQQHLSAIEKHDEYALQPFERGAKVGRNEPCPCGSGKKYKKCCLH